MQRTALYFHRRGLVLVGLLVATAAARGHSGPPSVAPPGKSGGAAESPAAEAPERVDVRPTAYDDEISARLAGIMRATGWFQAIEVHVDDGVVFLEGATDDPEHKEWITQLARRTQDVVA